MKSCFKKYAMVLEQGASHNLNGKKGFFRCKTFFNTVTFIPKSMWHNKRLSKTIDIEYLCNIEEQQAKANGGGEQQFNWANILSVVQGDMETVVMY